MNFLFDHYRYKNTYLLCWDYIEIVRKINLCSDMLKISNYYIDIPNLCKLITLANILDRRKANSIRFDS